MLARFKRLNYRHVLPDLAILTFSAYASLYLRLGMTDFLGEVHVLNRYILLFLTIRILTFTALGVYDIIWRYISTRDAAKVLRGILVSTTLIIATSYMVDIGHLPRATFIIDTFLVILMLLGIRLTRRVTLEHSTGHGVKISGRRVLIYGAGSNGRTLAHRFEYDGDVGYRLLGFIDDDPQKVGRSIAGTKVLGTRKELAEIIRNFEIQEIVVAISPPPADTLREIVQISHQFRIKPRLVNALSKSGRGNQFETFRNIELSDLLNRPRKNIDVSAMRELVRHRRVLITGAGGSIGSELARQVLQHEPATLLLLDHSEFNLYRIDQELRIPGKEPGTVVPLLVDLKDAQCLEMVFKQHLPEIVFHAAAYKHVHLVEVNPIPAILNNVLGTRVLLDVSENYDVETFVLISTDKAVNPVGIMGASKRACELMVGDAGQRLLKRYCAVRFGNVLGSSGSLIPLLKDQIQRREPVTITDKAMTRYFMLIPEAVSLVMKAATIASPGDITLLRMGDPMKIVDIARSLIALLGRSEKETPIVFTGLRPGEKLFEELYVSGQEINTSDPDILIVPRSEGQELLTSSTLREQVSRIIHLCQQGDQDAVYQLHALVKDSFNAVSSEASNFPKSNASLPTRDRRKNGEVILN